MAAARDRSGGPRHDFVSAGRNAFFQVVLVALLAAYPGRQLRLAGDNGRFFQHTQAVPQWLAVSGKRGEVFWLHLFCPSLNWIERLWGHLQRTVLANVWHETIDDLMGAFRNGMDKNKGHNDRIGSIFNHDEVERKRAG